MIHLENITKSFGNLQVLRGIDLEIEKGEIVSIVGPSGAGKTTLLQIMGTLDMPEAATEILEFMGLAERASHKPNELSGGEKQRVAVARALINHPAVVLADEPSGSLDTHNKEELHQLFFDLRNRFGQTFVIVTHDEGLAQLTDRTIHLIDGEINKMV